MKTDYRCRWVRHRLPLLAGGELAVDERRKVERHLIGCPGCQEHRDASDHALSALRLCAGYSPAKVDAPSLWPAVERQIRQSRHAAPRFSWWDRSLPRPWAFASLSAGLAAVLAIGLAQPSGLGDEDVVPTSPLMPTVATSELETFVVPLAAPLAPPAHGALPDGLAQVPLKPVEPPSTALGFDYDLDHGTPMSPANRDPQRTF